MIKRTLLFIVSLILCIEDFQAQTTITTTAGNLSADLKKSAGSSLSDIRDLTIKGTIDARDFLTMRDSMAVLETINLSDVSILEYKGYGGTWFEPPHDWIITGTEGYCEYGANAIPQEAFLKGYKNGLDGASYKGKKTLKNILFPRNLTNIEKNAFSDCTSIFAFSITENADNYKSIDGAIFNKNITELGLYPLGKNGEFTLPATTTKINSAGIAGCKFSKLVIQSSVPPELATKNFTATVISVPSGSRATYIAHEYWGNFTITEGDEELVIIQTNAEGQLAQKIVDTNIDLGKITKIKVAGPINWKDFETLNSMSVLYYIDLSEAQTTYIPGSAFHGNKKLNKIILPTTLQTIGDAAFASCSALEGKFTLPETVETIQASSFYECKGITEINFPASLTYLGSSSFYKCELTKVDLSACQKLAQIGMEAFYACPKLENVQLPPNIKEIEESAFAYTPIKKIILPDGLTRIGPDAFSEIPITTLTIPSSIIHLNGFNTIKVSQLDFSNCIQMESIGGFAGCVNLQVVDLSPCKALKTIEKRAFCSIYPRFVIQPTPPSYYAALTTIILPESLDSIKDDAFEACENLVTVDMSRCKNLKYIGSQSFQNCRALKSLEFPASFNHVGFAAFRYCNSFASLTLNSKKPPITEELNNVFYETPINKATLTIPKGSKAEYAFSEPWNMFGTIKESDISAPDIPSLDIKMIANGFSEYVSIKQKEISGIYFKSSDSSIPVCFRYKLKDPSWKSKMTLLYTPSSSSGATRKPLQFDEQGIAWIDTPEGYEVKDDELANYIIPQFNETGNLDYEITVYDQTKTTAYATFDCSLIVANTVDFTLSEINGAKETEISFTVTIANAGDFAGKKVKMSIEALGLNKDNTTIRFIDQETTETIPLTDPFGNGTCVNGEHILSNFSATTYHYTFKSTCKLTDVEMSIVFCDTENDWWISSGGKSVKININDQPTKPEDNFTSGLLEYEVNGNATVRISGVTDDTKTEYTIPSTVTHNNKTYSVTTIGFEAFQRCENLTRFVAPSSLDTIKGQAFSECLELKEVLLQEGLRIIESEAFCECTSLVNIDLPASVILIEEATFDSCSKLAKITVKGGSEYYKSVDGVLYDKKMSTLHTYPNKHASTFLIPEEVTQIGDYAFCNCTNLTSVTIHNKVKNIGKGAFEGCSGLKEISLPEGLESTGEGVFDSCTGLKTMTLPTSLKTIGYGMFDNCHETLEELHVKYATPLQLGENPAYTFFGYYGPESEICKLYVPKGSKAAYEKTAGWKEFKHILEEGGTTDDSDKPLTPPSPHADITLSSDSSYTDANGNQGKFNGTIGTGTTETEINTLIINNSTSATIKLNRVVIGDGNTTETAVSVSQNTIVTLQLQRENSLGKVINNGNMTLTGDPSASLIRTAVVNNGIFTDETTFVTQVEGAAALNISAPEDKEITEGKPVTLSASTRVSINYSLTFIWEQLQPDGSWKQIESHNTGRSTLRASETEIEDKLTITPDKTCQYRCRIKNQVEDISTTLITQPATVTVNPGDVGNASIETGRTVYVRNGILHICLATPDQVQIIHLNGTILRSLDLSAGETQITGLSEGVYIIRYRDSKTTKVVI